jgi:DMSO/TMAO reductase YedYZ molybdopterin-dependent catalytic subunit
VYRLLISVLCVALLVSCQATPVAPTATPAATAAATATALSTPRPTISARPAEIPPTPPGPTPTPLKVSIDGREVSVSQLLPTRVDNSALPVTRIEELHFTGEDPGFDTETWQLKIDGLVERPLTLNYADILARPVVTEVVLLVCPGVFADNAEWSGTPLGPILQEAGIKPGAKEVRLVGGDFYTYILDLDQALAEGAFLAYRVNGQNLPSAHGFPVRLVVRNEYGWAWVKWLTNITVRGTGN